MARRTAQTLLDPAWYKLIAAVLSKSQARFYYRRLNHWLRYKGYEWTADRLKALWQTAQLLRSGQGQTAQVLFDARIAQRDGLPVGTERALVLGFASAQSPSALRRASAVLRLYTGIVTPNVTKSQLIKSRDAITRPGKAVAWSGVVSPQFHLKPSSRILQDAYSAIQHSSLAGLHGTSRYPAELSLSGKELNETPFLSMAASLLTRGRVPTCLVEKLGDFALRRVAERIQEAFGTRYQGKIAGTPVGGAKARVFAMPNAWLQFYCQPYDRALFRVIWSLERGLGGGTYHFGDSCVFDQNRGVYKTLQALQEGRHCMSVDLSSATDRFPLSLQTELLQHLGFPEYGEALQQITGPWLGLDGRDWTWNSGQPMGLKGSFALFHLTHYLLISSIAFSLGLRSGVCHFALLGDDVVIYDEMLLRRYLEALELLQVQVALHKSYKGNLVEFAGFVITRSRAGWTAFRPYKGERGFSSVLNVLHAIGASVRDWEPFWSRAYGKYRATLGMRNLDLTPLVSEERVVQHQLDSLPGSRYFGSLFNRLLYSVNLPDPSLLEEFQDTWAEERHLLLKETDDLRKANKFAHSFTDSRNFVDSTRRFDPQRYKRADEALKRFTLYRTFATDPLISALDDMPG